MPSKRKYLLSCLLAILAWQILAAAIDNSILIASPGAVFRRFFTIWKNPGFCSAVVFSSTRIIGGFLLAFCLGSFLGILAARVSLLEILLMPWAALIKSVPVASFIIIALIWLRGSSLSIFISFLMVFPIVYHNILGGMKSTDPNMLELAKVYRLPFSTRLKMIYLPHLKPYLETACSTGCGIAWKAGIAAELIGIAGGSIGEKLYDAKITFETADLFVWTIVIVILSVLFEKVVSVCLKMFYRKLFD